MSAEISTSSASRYGLDRVCRVLEFPRSTIYAKRAAACRKVIALRPLRRGPKPKMNDGRLLEAIRADLAASPFVGEGHRDALKLLNRRKRLPKANAFLLQHGRKGTPDLCAQRGRYDQIGASGHFHQLFLVSLVGYSGNHDRRVNDDIHKGKNDYVQLYK